ncbi:MAG: hypothetical protein GKR89_11435 [Candidatus Latescibacteria bacterium]|nr:hypothetical protein [Candidatus Latescibacterota bacterium]
MHDQVFIGQVQPINLFAFLKDKSLFNGKSVAKYLLERIFREVEIFAVVDRRKVRMARGMVLSRAIKPSRSISSEGKRTATTAGASIASTWWSSFCAANNWPG